MSVSLKHRLEFAALKYLARKVQRMSPREASRYGRKLGRRFHRLWSSRRRIAEENLKLAFGADLNATDVERTAQAVFENFGETACEILRLPVMTHESLLNSVDGDITQVLDEALSLGKGAILMSGHLGNWELFGGWIAARGYQVDFLVKPQRNPLTNAFYNSCRRSLGVSVIETQNDTRSIIRALRAKRFVAILGDQYAGNEGIDVGFFGHRVSTPRGPAALALKLGVPIYFGVFVRQGEGRFLTRAAPRLDTSSTGNEEEDQRRIMQQYTSLLEQAIREYPVQWLWTHRRFGRTPPGTSREPNPAMAGT